ncbi:hypothetical protein M758_3G065300 [Ceratodon purpureus]|nr:hypothetical protein M758_3G065300 [Ceratodon purpureus]
MGPVKVPFADSDLTPLTKRYSSSMIVTMLREISRCKSAKLDWVMLCKGTATGITNPKEYQAVWRSIAYHAELDDSFDGNESPLEDDSDIEVDLDPLPSVSPAVAESLSSFVKADLQQHELEEARLEQNAVQTGVGFQSADIPTARLQQGSGLLGKSDDSAALAVTTNARGVPYLASATQCAATHGEPTATLTCSTSKAAYSGAMNQSDRKRRRLWTPEEDLALIAAVDKCGEGNWTTVLKNHYDFDRSASQLSQRWALIRKRREVQEKAGYGGSGVSLLATGFKDVRPEGLKSGIIAGSGSQLGTPKDVGKPGEKNLSSGNVPMPIKQPLSSTSSVPVSKRLPVASTPVGTETTPASVLETQRVRALPTSGVSSSWAGAPGQRPQAHNQASMRGSATAGASSGGQAHKGATPDSHSSGVRRPAQGPSVGSQMFYTSTQSATPTIPIDSKYAASRNVGAGVARGGSKGLHGPDPMIQAAAMAAGARIAPASAAASLLKAAQSGNVVHIGSGGLPRSKLGLTSQGGSGNAGGSPGIVHYIRTGSGGASLATTSTGLQRTSSHHMQKAQSNQPNRGLGSNSGSHPAGNSSPSVPSQASRNSAQAPVQSSKQGSTSKRGSSPQQKTSPSTSTPNTTPTLTSSPASTPASISVSNPAPTPAAATPASTPAPTSAPTLVSTPAGSSSQTSVATLAPTSKSNPSATSVSTPVPTSVAAPSPTSVATPAATSVARPPVISIATPVPKSQPATPAPPKSTPAPPPTSAVTSVARPAVASVAKPALKPTPAPAPTSSVTPICGFNTAEPGVDLPEEGTTP